MIKLNCARLLSEELFDFGVG